MEVAETLNEKISKYCQVTLDSSAFAGTGNVLEVTFFCVSVLQSIDVMTITILRVSRMYLIWSLEEVVLTKT